MKTMTQFLREQKGDKEIDRSAFLYMDPKEPKESFGQCGTCIMWTGPDTETCTIHGNKISTPGDYSCGLYVHGEPHIGGKELTLVTPKESGLVDSQVRCENCRFAKNKATVCGLFKTLNESFPDTWSLVTKIDPQGCCNAFVKK